MKIILELFQGALLQVVGWMTSSDDVFEAGERITRHVFTEYHQAVTVRKSRWEKVHKELQYRVRMPQGQPPFPGVLLFHGSSPAFSQSMLKRTNTLLANGYAVMTVNSFTRKRCLDDFFHSAEPPDAYQAHCNVTDASSSRVPALMQAYMNRVTKGYTLLPAERTQDFFAALEVMRKDPGVDSSRLSVIGYSHGGSVVLEALTLARIGKPPPGLDTLPETALDGVNAAIAYYPNCQPGTYFHWSASIVSIPTLMVLANQDEFVTPYFCRRTAQTINNEFGKRMIELLSFQNKHAFDMFEYPEAFDPASAETVTENTLTFIEKNLDTCPVPDKTDP